MFSPFGIDSQANGACFGSMAAQFLRFAAGLSISSAIGVEARHRFDPLGLSNRVPAVVRDRVHGVQLHGTAGGVSFLGPENPNSKAQHKEEGN